MMNIKEYFDNLYEETKDDNMVADLEDKIFEVAETDDKAFEEWALEHNIDLDARDYDGETALINWCTKMMCGE